MQPDVNKYLPMLDGLEISKEEKIELIHWLWNAMGTFVDRAFEQREEKKTVRPDLQDSIKALNSSHTQNEKRRLEPKEGGAP